ncbi:UxaA family hydrolase [Pectinatus haikarae]|uniref:UxaA family hydrolase n=1 Tax=Pectinatus haikarae TaxID=349096 RepID=UPI0018C79A91|nr:altronate dehydratase family protein [Pectinatus haikarae]
MKALHVNVADNVATALKFLPKGDIALDTVLLQDIKQGHKFATTDIRQGKTIIKYGSHIGVAASDIKAGQWVHIHNLESERGRGDTDSKVRKIIQSRLIHPETAHSDKKYSLMGYRRGDGSFGFRNHILVIPSVHCANKTVEQIANSIIYSDLSATQETNVVYVTHQHGCSELSYDAAQTKSVIVGTGANPNVYGVLVVGLGCEGVPAEDVAKEISERAPYKKVHHLVIQEVGGVNETIKQGVKIVKKMLAEAVQGKKTEGTLADVILGTECGGSDSFSGLSANPSLGAVSDIVIEHGGSVILAETTELIGAEHLLAERAENEKVKKDILDTVRGFEQAVIDAHADIRGANPSPGNIEGGLSSIEEKSLGCIYKAGSQPVTAVKAYAEQITDKGLTMMNTPGNDIEQLSGMAAGGCNICVFTTGRGTPTGSPIVPTIKVSSNSETFRKMNDMIDLDAGAVITGEKNTCEMGEEILDFITAVSNGMLTKAEINKQNDFSIWRLATTV